MIIVSALLFCWIAGAILLSFLKPRLGLGLYLMYLFLVPFLHINLGVSFSYNFVNAAILCGFLWNNKSRLRNLEIKPVLPFIFYFICFLSLIPFQNGMPWTNQLDYWWRLCFNSVVLPFMLVNTMSDAGGVRRYSRIIFVCIFVSTVYGVFLVFNGGVNLYLMLMAQVNGVTIDMNYMSALGSGRMFGRVASVFHHPMTNGLFLGLSTVYLFSFARQISRKFFMVIMILLTVNVFCCGIRSVIGALLVTAVFYLVRARNFRVLAYMSVAFLGVYIIVSVSPEFEDYLSSIFDFSGNKSNVSGSSFDMRLRQLDAAFYEIRDCKWFGKGFGWNSFYQSVRGDHPVLLAFESLVFVVLCNGGICGVLIWCFFAYSLLRSVRKYCGSNSIWLESLFVFYVAYSCITGEYGYMKYFAVFYVVMLFHLKKTTISEEENFLKEQLWKNH